MVSGICPACGCSALFLDDHGKVMCSYVDCSNPDYMDHFILIPKKNAAAALEIGELCDAKNEAYGNSFHVSGEFLKILWPHGVPVSAYQDMLTIARVFDKMMRIATKKDAFGEDPWKDIGGYAILMYALSKKQKEQKNVESK